MTPSGEGLPAVPPNGMDGGVDANMPDAETMDGEDAGSSDLGQ
jgi:hypothetical protein